MRLGIISDTHGAIENTRRAVRMLESLEVDRVLHCGDIGSVEIIELLRPWPTDFVFGNCDYDRPALRQAMEEQSSHQCHEAFASLNFENVPIALLHSDDRSCFEKTISGDEYRLVCYGHTHKAALERVGETLVLNPGAIYRAKPHSIAVVDLPRVEATLIDI